MSTHPPDRSHHQPPLEQEAAERTELERLRRSRRWVKLAGCTAIGFGGALILVGIVLILLTQDLYVLAIGITYLQSVLDPIFGSE